MTSVTSLVKDVRAPIQGIVGKGGGMEVIGRDWKGPVVVYRRK
jgi:hypothetical protein